MQTARASIKRKAEDSLNERPSKLVCSVVSSFSTITSRDVDNLTRQVRQYRLKSGPKLPKTREDVPSVPRDYDSDFVMEIDESLQVCLTTTVENLHFLSSSTHILADGTFQFILAIFTSYTHFTAHGMDISYHACSPCYGTKTKLLIPVLCRC
ncbi:ESX-1 secretion system protein EccCa1 [Elysia marginata]|uniref:ESX-1 secretion system protein EccCa1 n=1 Tax=Elysia marginata TaxID=1093978 RepID=A0AAV4HCU1_9GAST|nr:ESX-1 secretion system protein EccCa1 [Elysia marginata]